MFQLLRLSALVSIVYLALSALGKTPTSISVASIKDDAAVACTATAKLHDAVQAVDYAEAVLIANGEMYFGKSVADINADVAELAAFDDTDGISDAEEDALNQLLQFGRQLAFAQATEELERQLEAEPKGIRVASATGDIDYEILDALREGC